MVSISVFIEPGTFGIHQPDGRFFYGRATNRMVAVQEMDGGIEGVQLSDGWRSYARPIEEVLMGLEYFVDAIAGQPNLDNSIIELYARKDRE